MLRRKLTLLAVLAFATMLSACSDITSPSGDGDEDDGESRCQVVQGSDTRSCPPPPTDN